MPISAIVITLSDRAAAGVYEDKTGAAVKEILDKSLGCNATIIVLPDEQIALEDKLRQLCDHDKVKLIVTNGSTGVSPRDIAPEAILNVIDKRLSGFEEAMRAESLKKTVMAVISIAVGGIRKNTLSISVPGSPKAATENLLAVVEAFNHTIEKIKGDPSECGSSPK
jgi:molybdenum cofactor synthesis domain-containing protein